MKPLRSGSFVSLLLLGGLGLGACSVPAAEQDGNEVGSGGSGEGSDIGSPYNCDDSVPGERVLRRLTRLELNNSLADAFPTEAAQATKELPGDLLGSILLSNDESTLIMGSQMAAALLERSEQIATQATEPTALVAAFPCASTGNEDCVNSIIEDVGQRLFRRPITVEEKTRYVELHTNVSAASDFATGVKWVFVSLMQSPFAVYRSEIGEGGRLTPYELASQMSYNYSASPPSDELVALAVSGGLESPETRIAEARKLLQTERGRQTVQQFFREWLSYEQAGVAARANGPENFDTIRVKMVRETEAFLEKVLFEKDGDLAELFTADYTVADEELATYYGFAPGQGDLLAGGGSEVSRTHGVGVFAQGSVLTTMASVQITSPTRRGLLLLKRLYCEEPGLPGAVNFDLTTESVQGNTTRERLENSHLAQPSCQRCHAKFDPLGFAFEKFDHIGRYREEETNPQGTFPINDTTVVRKLDDLEVTGQAELMTGLAADQEVSSCVSGTLERYSYGGSGTCRAAASRVAMMEGRASLLEFLAQLAGEPHFVERN